MFLDVIVPVCVWVGVWVCVRCGENTNQEDVTRKITNAHCPAGEVEGNPCVDYVKHIVFGKFNQFTVAAVSSELRYE